MNEIIQRLIERTGLPEDKAATAVETVIGFLKERLPGPIAAQLDGVMGDDSGMPDNPGGMGSKLGGMGSGLGGMLGRNE